MSQDAPNPTPVDALAEKADAVVDHLVRIDIEGEVESFDLDGATIMIERYGSGERLFVLIHGIGMGRSIFGGLVEKLLPHGRVCAIDLPGYGEAPEPPRTPTIERMADTIAAYLKSQNATDAVVLGHSMGSQVAASLAVRHPELVGHLILAAPVVDATARKITAQAALLLKDLLDESPRVMLLGAREYLRAGPNLGMKMKAMITHRSEDDYPRVMAPTMVLRGETDPVSNERWAQQVAEMIPGAELRVIREHGHETLISDAGPAAELILSWLNER